VRKLATAAAVSLALASGSAKALILGEIEMRSALNQPIDAEIELSSVADGELEGMQVQLASQEAFSRAGIERSRVLTDLRFKVTKNASGQPSIQISSRKPVLEPFLNFLVDVEWRGGRLVREYTVLLDPPVFMTPSASIRNTNAETPATITVDAEDSILTPLPIDRSAVDSNVDEFDVASVATVGEVVDVDDDQVSAVDVDLGGVDVDFESDEFGAVVGLDEIEEVDDAFAGDFNVDSVDSQFEEGSVVDIPSVDFENDAIALSDLSVANPSQFGFDDEIVYDEENGWEVQVLGDSAEVGDEVGGSVASSEAVTLLSEGSATFDTDEFTAVGSDVDFAGGVEGGEVVVNRNDTLFEIAQRNALSGVSTQQMMMALLAANQQAFINGNINLVKAGAVLRIPDASSAQAISQSQALADVSSQAQLWREYRDNLRGVQSSRTSVAQSRSTPGDDDDGVTSEVETTSAAAQQILNQAREELREQLESSSDELKIVADTESTSTVASATADESNNPDTENLGSVNKKLQIAREELAAARLESEELVSQSTELDSVTDNMDQLVTMQQAKLAKLQEQLRAAQESELVDLEPIEGDVDGAEAEEMIADADEMIANVSNEVGGLTDSISEGVEPLGDTAMEQLDAAADQISDQAESAINAATDVDLNAVDETQVAIADGSIAANTAIDATQEAVVKAPWYQSIMNKQGLAIGGLGLLAGGGLFAVLRRRRSSSDLDDEALLDQVEFIDEEGDVLATPEAVEGTDLAADMTGETVVLDSAMGNADGPADSVAETGAMLDSELDALETPSVDDSAAPVAEASADETLTNDDTISEAEVYLAYGLHGQAEDLLTKAIEQNPSNAEYREKLLQTYHAQGDTAAFEEHATKFHQDFGGADNPRWGSICALGQELNAGNELFIADEGQIESLGKGGRDAPKMDSDDFLGDVEGGGAEVISQVREFSSSEDEPSGDLGIDETDLLDQSLDPGFAFDEKDLEATGDFTQVAEELNSESAANESTAKPAAAEEDGIIEFDAPEITQLDTTQGVLGAAETEFGSAADESIADDLSMDLNQLSDDIELDNTEMLADGMDMDTNLEMPDLTSDSDLTADSSAAFGDVDEMDTMMDLAKAYIDMGDNDSASSALGEIVKSGSPEQKTEAENLLHKIS